VKTDTRQKTALSLSVIIVVLATFSSTGGLFLDGLYRDNTLVTLSFEGNDIVTLILAIPMMITAMIFVKRGSIRAELIWLGMLDYMLYNFTYYLFGAAFNWFFLLYVTLFTLSIFTLIFGLINIDATSIAQRFRASTPVKWISGYMFFVAIGLSTVYVDQSLDFIITGVIPPIIEKVDNPTNVVFALDLSLLVPVLVLGAIWLWKRQPWGYILSGMALVKGASYTLVLTITAILAANASIPDASAELPFWVFITVLGTIACVLLYWNLDTNNVKDIS